MRTSTSSSTRARTPTRRTADPSSARELVHIDDFAPNHNGGLLMFGPDGELYLGMGDGGGAGDPERTAQNLDSPLGKLLRIDRDTGRLRRRRLRPQKPLALLVRPRHRRPLDRRRRPGHARGGRRGVRRQVRLRQRPELRLVGVRGNRPLQLRPAGAGRDRARSSSTATTAAAARSPAATSSATPRSPSLRGRYLYGDYCLGQLRSFTADPAGKATDDRELGVEVPSLSSFGEDRDGHIYAVSGSGPVYRLVAASS